MKKDNLFYRDSNSVAAVDILSQDSTLSSKQRRGLSDILFSFSMVALAYSVWVVGGFLWDDRYYVSENGLGYWLGIVGGVLMLIALMYSIVKRKLKRNPSLMRYWFITHTLFGIVGPIIILFHTTFHIGSLNGGVALISTMLVFLSGIIGRYFVTGVRSAASDAQQEKYLHYVRHWRAIHVPLLYLLFISGVIHVIAVHMY